MKLATIHIEASKQCVLLASDTGFCFPKLRRGGQSGFTLVELITIITIVGILAVAAVPRFVDNNSIQARGASDQVTAALRYGQKAAIAQHQNVTVTISSAASTNCGSLLAVGSINCAIANSVPVTQKTITFNSLGQPVPSNLSASVTVGTTTIKIEAETGYVH